jgi:hypothetical protein
MIRLPHPVKNFFHNRANGPIHYANRAIAPGAIKCHKVSQCFHLVRNGNRYPHPPQAARALSQLVADVQMITHDIVTSRLIVAFRASLDV